jgi:hypothetical protein
MAEFIFVRNSEGSEFALNLDLVITAAFQENTGNAKAKIIGLAEPLELFGEEAGRLLSAVNSRVMPG